MIFKSTLFLLGLFLYLSSVKAMEEDWELLKEDLQQVTVYYSKSQGKDGDDARMAVKTEKHYMCLRPLSDIDKKADSDQCFAPASYEADQAIQNEKFNTTPYQTLTLHLDAKSMDAMWESLLEEAIDRYAEDNSLMGKILTKVQYADKRMREIFTEDPDCTPVDPPWFTNVTMVKGLLGTGKLCDEYVNYHNDAKWFCNELTYISVSKHQNAFCDPIRLNRSVRMHNPSVEQIVNALQDSIRRQMYLNINKTIEEGHYGFKSLLPEHEKAIKEIVAAQEPQEERQKRLQKYLEGLGKTFESNKSWVSPSGWANTLYFGWSH